jgi:membrane protein involved in colicin uptake
MEDIITWMTSTPLGVIALVGALIVVFGLFAVLSERKTRRLFPDQERRGTKAVAKQKAAKKAAPAEKNEGKAAGSSPGKKAGAGAKAASGSGAAAEAAGTAGAETARTKAAAKTASGSGATKKATAKKKPAAEDEAEDEGFNLEGILDTLWGDEKTGKKGLFESLWEEGDDKKESK